MKIIITIVVAVVAMIFLGWLTFADSDDKATITIDKEEIKRDTDEAINKSKEVLSDAAENTGEFIEDVKKEGQETYDEAKEEPQEILDETGETTEAATDQVE